jgi:poly(A) polymerase
MNSAAIDIIRTLRERQHQAYLVGGCVRDLLLGREPADYDVATDATPEEVMRIFPQTYAVGAQFGVVLVPYKNERGSGSVEVATFRSDGAYSDGRHPDEVRFSKTPAEDAQRRDFTINGMLLDPLNGNQVLDYVGGRDDLRAGVVRTIGDPNRRFAEDKLRMLRAVRFAARFGYAIAPETFAAVRQHAAEIHQVSRERVRDELTKMLTEGNARRAFELLDESGLLHEVLPEIEATKGVEQPPQFHPEGDVWTHTLILLEGLEPNSSPTLAWGALLHDIGKPPTFRRAPDRIRFDNHADIGSKMAEAICQRLRMSNDETEQIVAIVANHMKFPEMPKMRESTLKRFLRQPKFDEHLAMHRLDCLASHGDLALYDFAKEKLANTPPEQIRPQPLLTGHDLIAAGYSAGPRFKQMLSEVEDAQLEGRLGTKQEAMELVLQRFGGPGCV